MRREKIPSNGTPLSLRFKKISHLSTKILVILFGGEAIAHAEGGSAEVSPGLGDKSDISPDFLTLCG